MAFPGRNLFRLKATHGLPLEFALDRVGVVEWPSFIDEARSNGWWDFQIHAALTEALIDHPQKSQILDGFKRFVLVKPHPSMN